MRPANLVLRVYLFRRRREIRAREVNMTTAVTSAKETPALNLSGRILELDGLRGVLVGMGIGFHRAPCHCWRGAEEQC